MFLQYRVTPHPTQMIRENMSQNNDYYKLLTRREILPAPHGDFTPYTGMVFKGLNRAATSLFRNLSGMFLPILF